MASTYGSRPSINSIRRSANGESSYVAAGPSRRRDTTNEEDLRDASGSEEEDEDEEDKEESEEGWTEDTFQDQPITQTAAVMPMIRGLSDKLKEAVRRMEEVVESTKSAAIALEEASPDDSNITNIDASLLKIFDQREILRIKIRVLEEICRDRAAGKQFGNLEQVFIETSEPRIQEWSAKSQRAKFKKSKEYSQFRSDLWEINHDTACPPVGAFLTAGPLDEEDSDDEIDVGGQTQTYRCPITLMMYKDATTCIQCDHTYSRDAIYDLIDNARKQHRDAKCPVTGCNKMISKTDLKANHSLQKRANEFARRQKEKDDEKEDDVASFVDSDDE